MKKGVEIMSKRKSQQTSSQSSDHPAELSELRKNNITLTREFSTMLTKILFDEN